MECSQRIAHSNLGEDIARLGSVHFHFATETIDVDLKHVTFAQIFLPPHMLEQQVLCDNTTNILRQVCNNTIFGWGKRYLASVQHHHVLGVVNDQVACRSCCP